MKLILDEWIVREVIDTLYMARTTFLGITGLDSPQEVEKKSANETAITRRISKAIDIIQQSEQLPLPNDLEEAAEKSSAQYYKDAGYSPFPNVETAAHKSGFITGAKWQKERDEKEQADLFTIVALDAAQRAKEQMLKEAVEGEVVKDINNKLAVTAKNVNLDVFKFGEKVKIIIVKKN